MARMDSRGMSRNEGRTSGGASSCGSLEEGGDEVPTRLRGYETIREASP